MDMLKNENVLMPRRLTAENGGKSLMIGEFFETISVVCPHCHGDGITEDGDRCAECDDCGMVDQKVPISWITIKEIYAKAVDLLGV